MPYFKLFLKCLIYAIFVVIIANPGFTNINFEDKKNGIDISIVLDISNSMLAEDMEPNRLEAAKKVIWDFVDRTKSDRISFVLFAWKPFVSIPLTFDYASIKDFVSNITTRSINQYVPWLSWTAIGDALIASSDSLIVKWAEKREKVIILVTDWEANVWIDPKLAIKYVNDKKIKVYTIWIWSKEPTELFVTDQFWNKQYFLDATWVPIKAKLDEDMLVSISSMTNWKYFNAKSEDSLKKIFESLSALNKKDIEYKSYKVFTPIYNYFLIGDILLIMLLLMIEFRYLPKF